jgi:hypothetical protein
MRAEKSLKRIKWCKRDWKNASFLGINTIIFRSGSFFRKLGSLSSLIRMSHRLKRPKVRARPNPIFCARPNTRLQTRLNLALSADLQRHRVVLALVLVRLCQIGSFVVFLRESEKTRFKSQRIESESLHNS